MADEYKVLLADDSAFARRLARQALDKSEFKVVGEAKTAGEAGTQYSSLSPDIVLLDVVMPEGGGVAALRQIMEKNPNAKVVMLSSMGTEQVVTECLTIGAQTFIQKPFDPAHLLATLRGLIGAPPQPTA